MLIGLLIVPPVVDGAADLGSNVEQGVRQVAYSVAADVGGVDRDDVDKAVSDAIASLSENRGDIAGGVLAGATALAQLLAALGLVIFLAFFLIKDGPAIARWAISLAPSARRSELDEIGTACWEGLTTFARAVVFVATFDAVFIAIALLLVGVPLVLPLAVLTFVAAFFPIIGAISAGVAAVLVALVSEGFSAAAIVQVAILIIQQIEGNILYPAMSARRCTCTRSPSCSQLPPARRSAASPARSSRCPSPPSPPSSWSSGAGPATRSTTRSSWSPRSLAPMASHRRGDDVNLRHALQGASTRRSPIASRPRPRAIVATGAAASGT